MGVFKCTAICAHVMLASLSCVACLICIEVSLHQSMLIFDLVEQNSTWVLPCLHSSAASGGITVAAHITSENKHGESVFNTRLSMDHRSMPTSSLNHQQA